MLVRPIALLLFVFAAEAWGDIRQFDIPTLERLDNELAHRDEIAARASDAVLDTQPAARALKLRGWISELSKSGDKVHLITLTPSGPVLAYTVTFSHGKPVVQDRRGQPMPVAIALRHKAMETALAALRGKLYSEPNYNYEVLNDPDGSGFLVYALAATTKKNVSMTGGHFRVTVSADGSKAERTDLLSALVVLPDRPKDAKMIVSTQLTSELPAETWLYTSHLYHLPVALGTRNRGPWHYWFIANGKIRKFTEAEAAAVREAEKKL
jgi:hypothetical protein